MAGRPDAPVVHAGAVLLVRPVRHPPAGAGEPGGSDDVYLTGGIVRRRGIRRALRTGGAAAGRHGRRQAATADGLPAASGWRAAVGTTRWRTRWCSAGSRRPRGSGVRVGRKCPRAPESCLRLCAGPPAAPGAPDGDPDGVVAAGLDRAPGRERVCELCGRGVGPDRQAGEEARPQCGGLLHRRDLDGAPDGIGQGVDERVGVRPAAVDAERRNGEAAVALARLDQIGPPVRDALRPPRARSRAVPSRG